MNDLAEAEAAFDRAMRQQALARNAGPAESRALHDAVNFTHARLDKLRAESARRAAHLPEEPPPPPPPPPRPVWQPTPRELGGLVGEVIGEVVGPLLRRLETLERLMAERDTNAGYEIARTKAQALALEEGDDDAQQDDRLAASGTAEHAGDGAGLMLSCAPRW